MPLSTEVQASAKAILCQLETQLPPPTEKGTSSPHFSAHVYCRPSQQLLSSCFALHLSCKISHCAIDCCVELDSSQHRMSSLSQYLFTLVQFSKRLRDSYRVNVQTYIRALSQFDRTSIPHFRIVGCGVSNNADLVVTTHQTAVRLLVMCSRDDGQKTRRSAVAEEPRDA